MKREQKVHELLLGSIVKISLQATAFAVGRLDKACPRLLHLFELSSQLNLKMGILNRQAHCGCPPVRTAAERAGIDDNLLSDLGYSAGTNGVSAADSVARQGRKADVALRGLRAPPR